jgi:hypothetical protein
MVARVNSTRVRGSAVPDVDEKVMSFVESVLDEDPDIQLQDLFERTKEFKGGIAELSKRQFNARYPLQVKRRRALAARKAQGERPRKARVTEKDASVVAIHLDASRGAVRQVLLRFAMDLAAAEERKELVKVLADVDRYVDHILEGLTGS